MKAATFHWLKVEDSSPKSTHLVDHGLCVFNLTCFTDQVKCILDAEHLTEHVLDEARLEVLHVSELGQVLSPHEGRDLRDEVAIIDGSWQVLDELTIDQEYRLFCALLGMLWPIRHIISAEVFKDGHDVGMGCKNV